MKGKVLINNTLGKAFNDQDFTRWITKPNNYLITDMASDFKDKFKDLDRVIITDNVSGQCIMVINEHQKTNLQLQHLENHGSDNS